MTETPDVDGSPPDVTSAPSATDLAPATAEPAGRLIVYDSESHLEVRAEAIAVGSTSDVIRGNGRREGDRMGIATVTGLEHGEPVLEVRFDGA